MTISRASSRLLSSESKTLSSLPPFLTDKGRIILFSFFGQQNLIISWHLSGFWKREEEEESHPGSVREQRTAKGQWVQSCHPVSLFLSPPHTLPQLQHSSLLNPLDSAVSGKKPQTIGNPYNLRHNKRYKESELVRKAI